jgi:hypothetical protein
MTRDRIWFYIKQLQSLLKLFDLKWIHISTNDLNNNTISIFVNTDCIECSSMGLNMCLEDINIIDLRRMLLLIYSKPDNLNLPKSLEILMNQIHKEIYNEITRSN